MKNIYFCIDIVYNYIIYSFERITGMSSFVNLRDIIGQTINISTNSHGSSRLSAPTVGYTADFGGHEVYLPTFTEVPSDGTGEVIAVIRRCDGSGVRLVAAPAGTVMYECDIAEAVKAYEGGHRAEYLCRYEKTCGAVMMTRIGGAKKYLLILNKDSGHIGFPKGHVEHGESEEQTACREVMEETGLTASLFKDFREEYTYTTSDGCIKNCVYFAAEYSGADADIQQSEISDSWLLPFEEAYEKLNYPQDKPILEAAHRLLQ